MSLVRGTTMVWIGSISAAVKRVSASLQACQLMGLSATNKIFGHEPLEWCGRKREGEPAVRS
jgi:hypothetical protein